jgi:threonine dehydrogenase-like Zn-dependent dehydrogenase
MKALRVETGGVRLSEVPDPERNGEALVRVITSGICNTDLEIVRGYAGFTGTIGHEFVGVVESADDSEELVGTRVVGEINAGCGKCDLCRSGDSRHCPERTVLGIHGRDGAHAEFLTLPARNLLPVPSNVSDEAAVFAEPLAAAEGMSERVDVNRETKVAIIGDGKLGLLCSMTMALRSDDVTLIGKHPEKMAFAAKCGVEGISVDASAGLSRNFDVVVEASGSKSGFECALRLVRPRGEIVLKSTFHGTTELDASVVVVEEISIVGSRCGRLAPALDLLASNRIDVENLISEEFRLADGLLALERAGEKGVLKVLLRP